MQINVLYGNYEHVQWLSTNGIDLFGLSKYPLYVYSAFIFHKTRFNLSVQIPSKCYMHKVRLERELSVAMNFMSNSNASFSHWQSTCKCLCGWYCQCTFTCLYIPGVTVDQKVRLCHSKCTSNERLQTKSQVVLTFSALRWIYPYEKCQYAFSISGAAHKLELYSNRGAK